MLVVHKADRCYTTARNDWKSWTQFAKMEEILGKLLEKLVKNVDAKRVTFNEITSSAVKHIIGASQVVSDLNKISIVVLHDLLSVPFNFSQYNVSFLISK